jgi:hypothetical protein
MDDLVTSVKSIECGVVFGNDRAVRRLKMNLNRSFSRHIVECNGSVFADGKINGKCSL